MKPFFFQPIYKTTLWGGQEIIRLKNIENAPENIGESWEISGVPGNETPVVGGADSGQTLSTLIEKYGADFVGRKNLERYGTTFPLLIKFISAAQDLSIQVHPDDEMAQRMGHPYGKTEMWYILSGGADSSLYAGFQEHISPDDYERRLNEGTFLNTLQKHQTGAGDCFFIPAGRIHSIGANNFLVEIQQSSNDTFRVYDFDRTDAQGNKRQLHVEQAKEALDFGDLDAHKQNYIPKANERVVLVESSAFTTSSYQLNQTFTTDYKNIDSFVILIAHKGSARCVDNEGNSFLLNAGESVLLPATTESLTFEPKGEFACIETCIP
ncbi:MAG: class I mannose-6-phosphate isomerase [Alloprevotella sp.]|nr:class I mannose-6-phosphate isomerase [Alloprevotella sp.]